MSLAWDDRPVEARGLLNPAFMALLLAHGSVGYAQESDVGLPYPLAFLLPPIVLHTDTRERLPTNIRTSLAAWLAEQPYLRETFPPRVRALVPHTREAVGYGLAGGLLEIGGGGILISPTSPGAAPTQSTLTRRLFERAHYVGRWFARTGSVATVYTLWGVRP
jgi:Family of unknown function (DUF6521)